MKYVFLAIACFCSSSIYRRRNNDLEVVVSMLSCGGLERRSNPHIESIIEPFISQNQKKILAMWV